MPAQSQKQREWAFAVKGPAWAKAHHFDNPGKLPTYKKKSKNQQIHEAAVAKMRSR
jgi:hypothetical protein